MSSKSKNKVIELEEAESDEKAAPDSRDDERARVRAAEFSPLIADLLGADEDE